MERFKPEKGETYFVINRDNPPSQSEWCGDNIDKYRYDSGNCFRTEAEAQSKIDRDKRIASGRAVVVDVPEGFEVESTADLPSVKAKIIYFQPTPPPPREIMVKVYDQATHGTPNPDRVWYIIGNSYYYADELEGM